jgi:hypothetical protein
MRGPPPAHLKRCATRMMAPSPAIGMANRIEDVSGGVVDRADETWLQEAAEHIQVRASDRTRVG